MEIIQSNVRKIAISFIIMILLIAITIPIFAVSKGEKYQFTANAWKIYKTEAAAKSGDQKKVSGYLKNGQQITVSKVSGNIIYTGSGYIIYNSSYFKKVSSASNTTKPTTTKGITVTFNGNGSGVTGLPSPIVTKAGDKKITFPTKIPTRSGYKFLGWSSTPGDKSPTFLAGTTRDLLWTTNKTVYAIWQKNQVTTTAKKATTTKSIKVTFNGNGSGVTNMPSTITTKAGDKKITFPTKIPTRSGYKFLGWSTIKSAKSPTFIAGSTRDLLWTTNKTVYAIWQKNQATVIKESDFKLNTTSLTIEAGKTAQIKVTAKNGSITYTSKDSNVATVDKSGKVTAKKQGNTKITVTYKLNNQTKTAECAVNVNAKSTSSTSNSGKTSYLSEANLDIMFEFISKFEGNGTSKKNGITCYQASKDTDGKMRCVGVDISSLKPITGLYYNKDDVDEIIIAAIKAKQKLVIGKANNLNLKLKQNELMALTSLAYQCSQTSVTNIVETFKKEGSKAGMERLLLYTKANGTIRGGIVKRRNAEACLIMDGSYNGKYCNDTKSDLKYYKKVTQSGYEFSFSRGEQNINNYKACYNKV